MAGEIQLNSTTMATESSGSITLSNVNSATNRTNLGLGSISTQNANAVALTGGSLTGTEIDLKSSGTTIYKSDGTTAVIAESSGDVSVSAKRIILASGGGISFYPGADSSDLNTNVLEDYETGTFTPTFTCATNPSSLTITYDATFYGGMYIKIGHLVYVQMFIRTDSVSTGSPTASGNLIIEGLPFVPYNRENYDRVYLAQTNAFSWASNAPIYAQGYAENSDGLLLIYNQNSNGSKNYTQVSDMNTGANQNYIGFSGTYWTNS